MITLLIESIVKSILVYDHRAISCGPLVYTEVGKNSLAIHTAPFLRWIPRTYWRVSLPHIERRYPPAQASSASHDRAFALTRDGVQNAAPLPGQSGPCGPGAHSRPCGARRPSCGSARPPGPRRARPPTQLLPPGAREDCGQRGPAASPIPLGPAAGGRGRGGGTVPARRQDGRAPAPQCSHLAGRGSGRLRRGNRPLRWGTVPRTTALGHGRAARSNRARRPQGRGAEPSGRADQARGLPPSPGTLIA